MKKLILFFKRRRGGVALIISVGVLALVAMIATSFAINMQAEYRSAANYLNSVKAEAVAQAGIEKMIADIRTQVKTTGYANVIYYINNLIAHPPAETLITAGNLDTYQITIEREDQKININALDEADYVWIDRLRAAGLTYNDIAKIIDYRDSDSDVTTEILTSGGRVVATGDETNAKNAPYATVEELRLVLNDAKYNAIKNIVTVYTPVIRGGLIGKYYGTNKASFNKDTILSLSNYKGKVIELGEIRETSVPSADNWQENHDAEFAGAYLVNDLVNFTVDHFGVRWEGYIDILPSQVGIPIYFWTRSDDGNRLYINGERIIDNWRDQGMWDPSASKSASYSFKRAGWHQIKLEYYDNEGENSVWLKWDTQDHSNGEWISNDSIPFVPVGRLGYYPPSWIDYNSGGYYKITSTGQIKSETGNVLAVEKITAAVKIFGTWTQTTRAEFYAPWYFTYNRAGQLDCSDGAVNCVTFLDSCPTNSKDNWDIPGYKTIPDSLKLGFWDNLDEDVGYSETMLVSVINVDMNNFDVPIGSGNKLKVWAPRQGNREIEINGGYYWLDDLPGSSYDLFARAWEYDGESAEKRLEPPWSAGWLFAKHWSYNGNRARPADVDKNYYTLLKREYMPYWRGSQTIGGLDELTLAVPDPDYGNTVEWPYSQAKVLGITGSGVNYKAYVNFVSPITKSYGSASIPGSICLMTCNAYEFKKVGRDGEPEPVYPGVNGQYYDMFVNAKGGWTIINNGDGTITYDFKGGTSYFETFWDNIRVIPKKGWFISTPCYGGEDVEWGTLSWTGETPGETTLLLYTRVADTQAGLGVGNTGWLNINSSGSQIPLAKNKWIQYKAEFSSNITSSYPPDTPALEDVTITYLPTVEILYRGK